MVTDATDTRIGLDCPHGDGGLPYLKQLRECARLRSEQQAAIAARLLRIGDAQVLPCECPVCLAIFDGEEFDHCEAWGGL